MRRTSLTFRIGRHAFLAATGAFVLLPFVWMVALSLKPPGEIFTASPQLFPSHWYAVENYSAALTRVPLLRFMLNGAIVCAAVLVLQLLISLPCAYALAKLRFRGRNFLFGCVLAALIIPMQVLAIPLFIALAGMGLINTYAALVLPWAGSAFCIFLLRQFFLTVPDELLDAARLDGMSELGILVRLMLPSATPAIAAFAIFSVVYHWNDLFWPLIVTNDRNLATAPLGLMYFRDAEVGNDYGPLMAGAVLITAPLVLTFLFAQRWFIAGLTMTGIK
jgi:multiple sugar transport system permease protein